MAQNRWVTHDIRVRYQETDQMGVVYHANYLNWFEIGRTELIRGMGMPYTEIEAGGLLLPVIDARIQFHRPAKYDDLIRICTRISGYSNVRMQFEYEIRLLDVADAGDGPLVSGATEHVWLNREWKMTRIDRAAPGLFCLLEESGSIRR